MHCLLCDRTNLELYTQNSFFGLPILKCNACDLYITGDSEELVAEKIQNFYSRQFWDLRKSEDSIKSNFTDANSQSKKRNWVSQIKYCPDLRGKTILEIGAGAGQNTFFFDQEGYNISAIEPDQRNVDLINQKLSKSICMHGYVETFESDKKYDCIWMSHVLEHFLKPTKILVRLKTFLNHDGFIFVEVPNCGFKENLDKTIVHQPHTFHFTKKSIMLLAQKAGFQIIMCDCFRAASKRDGALHKFFPHRFPHYPRIQCHDNQGKYLRIVLKIKA